MADKPIRKELLVPDLKSLMEDSIFTAINHSSGGFIDYRAKLYNLILKIQ